MILPDVKPTRKQRFTAALALAGVTLDEWMTESHEVSKTHLYAVLNGERNASPELDAAIDATIQKYLGAAVA